jgi:hypothetical protein
MGTKIEKNIFNQLIKKFVNEHSNSRTTHSTRIDQIAGDELPVLPNEHMPLQLSTEMPDVADDEYMPTTTSALSDAAATIAHEVPGNQIEFFYNQLHSLLKRVADRENEEQFSVMEALLFEAIDDMSNMGDEDLPDLDDDDADDMLSRMDPENQPIPTAQDIAQKIMDKGHTNKAAIHDRESDGNLDIGNVKSSSANFASFGHKARRVELPAKFAMHVTADAIESDPEIRKMISRVVGDTDQKDAKTMLLTLDIKSALHDMMKKRTEISPELAAEMHANRWSDAIMKRVKAGLDSKQDHSGYEQIEDSDWDDEASDIDKYTYLMNAEIKRLAKYATNELVVKFLELARDKQLSGDTKKIYDEDEAEKELGKKDTVDLEIFDSEKAEKKMDTNLENQADLFGFSGANGIRQWFQKHPEVKFMTLVRGASDIGNNKKIASNTSSALEAFLLAPGIEKWFKKIRKQAPKGLLEDKVENIIAGIEAIINDVNTGDEEIDFKKLESTSAGWIIRSAFDKLILSKTFGTFFNNRREQGISFVEDMELPDKQKRALGDMLAGISKEPEFDKEGNPLNSSAKKVLAADITPQNFNQLQKNMNKKIESYFDENINDIKKYFNKQLQDDAAVMSSLSRAVVDIRDEIEERMAAKNVRDIIQSGGEE